MMAGIVKAKVGANHEGILTDVVVNLSLWSHTYSILMAYKLLCYPQDHHSLNWNLL